MELSFFFSGKGKFTIPEISPESTSVDDIKSILMENFDISNVDLLFHSKILTGNETINSLNITENDTLTIVKKRNRRPQFHPKRIPEERKKNLKTFILKYASQENLNYLSMVEFELSQFEPLIGSYNSLLLKELNISQDEYAAAEAEYKKTKKTNTNDISQTNYYKRKNLYHESYNPFVSYEDASNSIENNEDEVMNEDDQKAIILLQHINSSSKECIYAYLQSNRNLSRAIDILKEIKQKQQEIENKMSSLDEENNSHCINNNQNNREEEKLIEEERLSNQIPKDDERSKNEKESYSSSSSEYSDKESNDGEKQTIVTNINVEEEQSEDSSSYDENKEIQEKAENKIVAAQEIKNDNIENSYHVEDIEVYANKISSDSDEDEENKIGDTLQENSNFKDIENDSNIMLKTEYQIQTCNSKNNFIEEDDHEDGSVNRNKHEEDEKEVIITLNDIPHEDSDEENKTDSEDIDVFISFNNIAQTHNEEYNRVDNEDNEALITLNDIKQENDLKDQIADEIKEGEYTHEQDEDENNIVVIGQKVSSSSSTSSSSDKEDDAEIRNNIEDENTTNISDDDQTNQIQVEERYKKTDSSHSSSDDDHIGSKQSSDDDFVAIGQMMVSSSSSDNEEVSPEENPNQQNSFSMDDPIEYVNSFIELKEEEQFKKKETSSDDDIIVSTKDDSSDHPVIGQKFSSSSSSNEESVSAGDSIDQVQISTQNQGKESLDSDQEKTNDVKENSNESSSYEEEKSSYDEDHKNSDEEKTSNDNNVNNNLANRAIIVQEEEEEEEEALEINSNNNIIYKYSQQVEEEEEEEERADVIYNSNEITGYHLPPILIEEEEEEEEEEKANNVYEKIPNSYETPSYIFEDDDTNYNSTNTPINTFDYSIGNEEENDTREENSEEGNSSSESSSSTYEEYSD